MMTIVLPAVAVVLAFLAPAAESAKLTEVVEGSALELQCDSSINEWFFEGAPLIFSGGISCGGYCNLSHDSLVFRAVLRQHQGEYSCIDGVIYIVTVIVVALPEPDGQSLRTGGALNLTYSLLEGGVATAVRWYRDGEPLRVGGRVSVSGQSLLMHPLEMGDAGEYSVEVDNGAGTGSATVRVSIKFPPKVAPIIAMPTSLVTPTINVTLVCTIVSNPNISSVHWRSAVEGRAPNTVTEESRLSESGQYGQVTTTSMVVVLARGAEEQYTYTCSASNALGEDEANITVHEEVAPFAPTGVQVSAATSTTLTLHWDVPLEPSRVETYIIELRRGQGEWAEARTTPGGTYSITLEQLLPNTLYQVRVAAQNQVGSGVSEAVTASTTHQTPFLPPSSVVAQWNQTGTFVELSWRPPSIAVIEGYSVVARLLNSTVVQAVNVSAPRLSFSTLTRGTSYLFEVAAYNSGGEGPKASLTYTVPPVRIAPVVSIVRLTPSSFSLSWPRPADASELAQYRVTVVESVSAEQWTAVVDSTTVSCCFTGLLSSGAYRVALTAHYIDGSSTSSGHQDIPKEGDGGGDNGCSAIIPVTGLPTAPPAPGMTPVIAGVVVGVVGVAIMFVLVTVIVASVACAWWRGWQKRRLDLDNSSSGSNSRMTTGGCSPRPNSPQLKSILVYNSAKDSTRLQYYDVDSIFGTLSDSDKAHSQIVGFEV